MNLAPYSQSACLRGAKQSVERGQESVASAERDALRVFLISLPLVSQTSQGTIQGAIFDQSGGAIPGAMVTVVDVARGVTRALTTDSAGQYVAANLTPGTYTVRGEAKGFPDYRAHQRAGRGGTNIRVDLTLQPGAQTQTITVNRRVCPRSIRPTRRWAARLATRRSSRCPLMAATLNAC